MKTAEVRKCAKENSPRQRQVVPELRSKGGTKISEISWIQYRRIFGIKPFWQRILYKARGWFA